MVKVRSALGKELVNFQLREKGLNDLTASHEGTANSKGLECGSLALETLLQLQVSQWKLHRGAQKGFQNSSAAWIITWGSMLLYSPSKNVHLM